MNAFCPNLSNPQVKQEFEELVQAVGEDAAYFLWNKNNGYSLESAPNGAPSRLFKDLVDYYSGNREKALQTKGKTYLQQFKDTYLTKDQLDENEEPTIQSLKLPKRESTDNIELFDKSLQKLTEQIDQSKFLVNTVKNQIVENLYLVRISLDIYSIVNIFRKIQIYYLSCFLFTTFL